ncbi:MAG: tetratricopeptide repeat protein [Lachnospiraceae bacterium]|nr:tetratricopeptide repeat protein [Lachnospiraceae bacterium]
MKKKCLWGLTASCLIFTALCGCRKPSTAFYDAGVAYLENKQYDFAEENLRLSLEQESPTKECYRLYGIACLENGNYEAAVEAFISALQKNNGDIREIDFDINRYLGYAYENMGDYQSAVDVYNAVLTVRPKDTDSFFRRAVCYLKLGDMTAADNDFSTVTSRDPSNFDLHLKVFYAISSAGYATEASSYLKALLESERKISDFNIGRIYFYLGDYSNARVYLEKSKNMSDADTILMLGKTYEAIGDFNYAGSLYTEYLNAKGGNAAIYNRLGLCRSLSGDYEGAQWAFSHGLTMDEKNEYNRVIMFNEAVTAEFRLEFDEAKQKFLDYLKLYPKDEAAIHELAFLETRKTETDESNENK